MTCSEGEVFTTCSFKFYGWLPLYFRSSIYLQRWGKQRVKYAVFPMAFGSSVRQHWSLERFSAYLRLFLFFSDLTYEDVAVAVFGHEMSTDIFRRSNRGALQQGYEIDTQKQMLMGTYLVEI